jgi:osmotically inducible protein OsmC
LVAFLFQVESAVMKVMIRNASVRWKGGPRGGIRAVTTKSRSPNLAKIKPGRPKNESDTYPAELIAAAHASSFSRALSDELALRSSAMGDISTSVTVTLENPAAGWVITNIHLAVVASLPGVTQGRFIDATVRARTSCFVSRLLHLNISMNAKLESEQQLEPRRRPSLRPQVHVSPINSK